MKKKSIVFSSILISVTMFWIGCKKNRPPDTPTIVCEAESGYANVVCDFSVVAFDPDDDSISYQFNWGNEDTSDWSISVASGDTIIISKAWSVSGNYLIRAKARDQKYQLSKWSEAISINILNNSSPVPTILTSPPYAWVNDTCIFSFIVIEPDNDSIALRIDWDDDGISDWNDFVPSSETITMVHSYAVANTYEIKAQAKDIHGATSNWLVLDTVKVGQLKWTRATNAAGWFARSRHTSVVFDNKMWVIGGYGVESKNDVWYSSDGANWICATESAEWSPRGNHTSVVFDNKIWVIGSSDVWYSSDGVTWSCTNDSAGWSTRISHTSVVFDDKMWVIGGGSNDVWYSLDGINWICATNSAEWGGRANHASVVFDDKIWVLGGLVSYWASNDVWYSSDGVNWTRAIHHASWQPRESHTAVVFDNKMWVIRGYGGSVYDDAWYSKDGRIWSKALASTEWREQRREHTSLVFDDKIWVIGGLGYYGENKNDVWYGEIVRGKR